MMKIVFLIFLIFLISVNTFFNEYIWKLSVQSDIITTIIFCYEVPRKG